MVTRHQIPQDMHVTHVSSLPPRRTWRTLSSLQQTRADQQRLRRVCTSHKTPRCHAVHTAAAHSQNATLEEQAEQSTLAQPDDSFEGLGWVSEQESELAAEFQQEEQEQWLQSAQTAQPRRIKHIDEDQPVRHKFHRRMMQAAANGQASDVSEILEEMQEDGIEPGPYAYHALVFANVKSKDTDAALEVMRLMHKLGLQALVQSYCAVILSFVRDEQPEHAMAVFASMRRSGVNAYPGWLTITNQLFAAGQQELAEQCVLDRQPDWQPDADVYEHIIKSICSGCQEKPAVYTAAGSVDAEPAADSEQTVSDHFLEASNILAEMKGRNITPEVRHMHPILEAYARLGGSTAAERMLQEMIGGRHAAPDAKCFELLAQAHIQSGKDGLIENLQSVGSLMTTAGLQLSKKFRVLIVEADLLENRLEDALQQFHVMRSSGRIRGVMRLVPDPVLAALLHRLSAANMPAELLRMLKAMSVDGRRMPAVEDGMADKSGRSLLTSWLASPRSSTSQGFEGVMAQPKEATDEVTDIDGVSILGGKYAVNADGKVLSPSSQTMPQLKAELTARNLSTEGKRDDLKRRVMAARNAEPPDMAKAIRKKEAQREAKRNKLEKAMKEEAAASKAGEAPPAGSLEDRRAKVQVVSYGIGKATVKEEFETVVEDEDEGITGDDAAEDGIAMDPMEASNAATAVNDDDYVVGEDDREDMLDEDNDILDDLPPARDNGAAVRQQTAVAAAAQRPVSNADAGADVAMQILRLCEGLGGSATAHDYEQILQVSEAEGNAIVARNLVRSWHTAIQSAYDQATVNSMYTRAARVCTESGDLASAQEILTDMQSRAVEADNKLQADIDLEDED